jgi:hypothetical protein
VRPTIRGPFTVPARPSKLDPGSWWSGQSRHRLRGEGGRRPGDRRRRCGGPAADAAARPTTRTLDPLRPRPLRRRQSQCPLNPPAAQARSASELDLEPADSARDIGDRKLKPDLKARTCRRVGPAARYRRHWQPSLTSRRASMTAAGAAESHIDSETCQWTARVWLTSGSGSAAQACQAVKSPYHVTCDRVMILLCWSASICLCSSWSQAFSGGLSLPMCCGSPGCR